MKDISKSLGDLLLEHWNESVTGTENIVNGTFETGDWTGWSKSSGMYIGTGVPGSYQGVHAAYNSYENVQWIEQAISNVPVDDVSAFTLAWKGYYDTYPTPHLHYGTLTVLATYSDNTTSTVNKTYSQSNTWQLEDLKSMLTSGKILTKLRFTLDGQNLTDVRIDSISVLTVSESPLIAYDEFDPRNPSYQILLENLPNEKGFLSLKVFKIKHRCRVTVWTMPVHYEESSIENSKDLLLDLKTEVDRILVLYKFSVSGVSNIVPLGWNDIDSIRVGRGTKGYNEGALGRTLRYLEEKGVKTEPILFFSQQIVSVDYYEKRMVIIE